MPPPPLSKKLTSIQGVRLAGSPSAWNINIHYPPDSPRGIIQSMAPRDATTPGDDSVPAPLALPALTHPHIHLDKAFVHSVPQYAHLLPATGTFQEALSFTTEAKQQFSVPDVLQRGEWLLAESVSAGVTAMRAFVEVDHTVNLVCLEAATILQDQWKDACEIQIVCFAQDPIFSTEHGEENLGVIEKAFEQYPQIGVIGTTPYVESTLEAARRNIDWAIDRALQLDKHLDFHLDYNLDAGKEAMIWYVLHSLQQRSWTSHSTSKRVMLGHCTRHTLFTDAEWTQISRFIHDHDIPVSFVGLPTSDLYMAASPDQKVPHDRPRGTLRVPEMIRKHDLDAVMGVNNVGNAFTPWGPPDPLFLACLGVGVYQAGTQDDARLLYECVSTRARAAIGLSPSPSSIGLKEGGRPDFLLFYHRDLTGCGVARPCGTVAEVVWDPPATVNRDVVIGGRLKRSDFSPLQGDSIYKFSEE
ncbi:Cytosine deaminase [Penicillium rolfsii]|nr:Cytosine deaminase [Penicillium rolfsii]